MILIVSSHEIVSMVFGKIPAQTEPLRTPPAESDVFTEPIEIEITDVFDLHSIPPKQVKSIVKEYLHQAYEKGFRYVRIIHGKGIGVQREMTRKILAETEFVQSFSDAPPEAGGWGTTIVELKVRSDEIKVTSCE